MKSNSKFLFSVCLFLPFILSCQQKIETDNNEDTVMGQYYLDWASWYGCPVDENSTHQNPMYLMDNYRNTVDYWEPYNIIDVVKALPHSDDDNGYRESEYTIGTVVFCFCFDRSSRLIPSVSAFSLSNLRFYFSFLSFRPDYLSIVYDRGVVPP